MSSSVILGRVGAHVLDQIEQVLLRFDGPWTGVGPGVWLRTVEVAIPFASSDGTSVSPATVVVGETPLPLEKARELLVPLERRVLVRAADLEHSPQNSRGLLLLRVQLPQPAAPSSTLNDSTT